MCRLLCLFTLQICCVSYRISVYPIKEIESGLWQFPLRCQWAESKIWSILSHFNNVLWCSIVFASLRWSRRNVRWPWGSKQEKSPTTFNISDNTFRSEICVLFRTIFQVLQEKNTWWWTRFSVTWFSSSCEWAGHYFRNNLFGSERTFFLFESCRERTTHDDCQFKR